MAVTTRQAAEHYGLKVARNGMTRCPFHNDRTPSLKVDERYYCFGCGATGDVVDFTARLYGLGSYEAAQKLAADFGISMDTAHAAPVSATKKLSAYQQEQRYKEQEQRCFATLTDYLWLLWEWKENYAPKTADDPIDDRFVEACQMEAYIEYLTDIFITGDKPTRMLTVEQLTKDGKIQHLREYVSRKRKEEHKFEQQKQPHSRCGDAALV